ncbi:MAG: hypothetical protein ACI9OJ_005697, partial [Myxococcota bacterium]
MNLATETDIERLRLVALGLEAEVRALHERLARRANWRWRKARCSIAFRWSWLTSKRSSMRANVHCFH